MGYKIYNFSFVVKYQKVDQCLYQLENGWRTLQPDPPAHIALSSLNSSAVHLINSMAFFENLSCCILHINGKIIIICYYGTLKSKIRTVSDLTEWYPPLVKLYMNIQTWKICFIKFYAHVMKLFKFQKTFTKNFNQKT